MARRTVRIDIPHDNVDDTLDLMKQIIKQDSLAPADKKLNEALITAIQGVINSADPIRIEAKDHEGKAQANNQLARNILGIDKGQSISIIGTGLNLINKAKKNLVDANENNEEALTVYGFKVVVGTAKSPKRKPKE
jgi:hypothetical protein